MTAPIKFIIDFLYQLFSLLTSATFEFFGYQVSYGWLIVGFICISIILSVLWKGAKG